MAWVYLLIAALFEAAWTFSLKFLIFKEIKNINPLELFEKEGILKILPLIGYIIFGIGNIYFFSKALKVLPTAMCVAIWMALALFFIKCSEILFFEAKFSWSEAFFLILISIGIVGLKVSN
jgi:quaternary ammonium compound-resistance protein SugE